MDRTLFITTTRERDIIRYSERNDQKDAVAITEPDAIALFIKNGFTEEHAKKFIENLKKNPFSDWCQWR